MEKEIWKDIPGYEGLYQISTLGNIKSLDRIVIRIDGKKKTFKGKKISVSISQNYKIVNLHNHYRKSFRIHQLMAITFLGHIPCGHELVVDHIDNNPLNNDLSNLQIVTNRFNTTKNPRKGTSKYIGVSWDKSFKKWRSGIRIKGKYKHIGHYSNEEDASKAYQEKLKELYQT